MTITRRDALRLPGFAVFLPMTQAAAPPSLPAGTPLRLLWIWPDGERLDAQQAQAARSDLALALSYWNARAPHPGCYVQREEAVRIADPYASHQWLYKQWAPGVITVCVVINQASRRHVDLGGGIAAPAYNWPGKGVLYCSLQSGAEYRHVGAGCQLAHELGHALYNLPEEAPGEPMMGNDYADEWGHWVSLAGCN